MARKTKRRPFYRPRPQQRTEDAASEQRRIEAAAQSLIASATPEQIRDRLAACESLLLEADQLAQLDPSPASLARYRAARSQYQTARMAAKLCGLEV